MSAFKKGELHRAWAWPVLMLAALAGPAFAADRVVISEEFTDNE